MTEKSVELHVSPDLKDRAQELAPPGSSVVVEESWPTGQWALVRDTTAPFGPRSEMADDKPAPEHPAPWRWDDWLLADNGDIVVSGEYGYVEPANAYVGELIRSAPEMEGLLRKLEWIASATTADEPGDAECPICGSVRRFAEQVNPVEYHYPDCKFGSLLARLDAAKVAR
ncbi:MAG TPA: hypothetical protein VHG72_21855 [Polyangia bacterium]|nr:hypothetical protein [Polyangia bacterium]